jgi:hypothetical protein
VRELLMTVGRVEHEMRAASNRVRSDLGLGLDEEAAKRQAQITEIATRGVRGALAGLALVAVGILLQLVSLLT